MRARARDSGTTKIRRAALARLESSLSVFLASVVSGRGPCHFPDEILSRFEARFHADAQLPVAVR